MIKEKLHKIGLTKGESEIYELLIKTGQTKAGILIKQANLASSKVYDVLQKMINKGLVSFVEINGIKNYQATSPKRLIDFLENKKLEINDAQEEIINLIPLIEKQRDLEKEFSNTRMYFGIQGAKIALQELAEESRKEGINYGYGTQDNPFIELIPHDLNRFFKEEKEYGFETHLIFAQGKKQKQPNARIRYLPPEFISPVRTMIAGNKIFLVDFIKPITTIIIENKQISNSYKEHFKILWKIAKKTS